MKSLFFFAILFLSANALSLDSARHHQLARQLPKRSNSNRCKSRSTSSTPQYTPPSTPTPTPAPAPAPTSTHVSAPSPPISQSGSKAGVAWSQSDNAALQNFMVPGRVLYTWTPDRPSNIFGGQFAAMLRSDPTNFQQVVHAGYANYALGFNEPELGSQDNISPEAAVQLWNQYMGPLKNQGIKFGSPAITSVPDVSFNWLKSFFQQCVGCQIDFACMHYYGTDAQDFITYVTNFHNTFGLPVWVTEFAPWSFSGGSQLDQQQVNEFMQTVTQWMDNTDFVEHYFPFGVMPDMGNTGVGSTCQLMKPDGSLNALAEIAFQ